MRVSFFVLSVVFVLLARSDVWAAATISIPCVDDSGVVKNAQPTEVCKPLLPKCSELKNELISNMKNMIEVKLHGFYYLGKDVKLDKISGMNVNGIADGEPLPYPVCSVVGDKISANQQGEVERQSIGLQQSCGEFPKFANGSAWDYKTKIKYEGEYGKRWFSYILGVYPWELRRNAYEVKKALKNDLTNLNEVIHSDAMTQDVLDTLALIKKSTLALSADAKMVCYHPPATDIVEACKSPGTLSITDPILKLCNLVKAQLALNGVALPNMLVYEVMSRTKKMHSTIFDNFFVADKNFRFKALLHHCADNKSLMDKIGSVLDPIGTIIKNAIMANKSYSCNTSCMTDGEVWYTNTTDGDGVSWKNGSNSTQRQRKCSKISKFNLLTGMPQSSISSVIEPQGWVQWLWNSGEPGWWSSEDKNTAEENFMIALNISNPTNNRGVAGLIESIIRRDICPQAGNSKTGANVCDEIDIRNKPVCPATKQYASGLAPNDPKLCN